VLDVDGDACGYQSLAQLEHERAPLPLTQRVQTSSGEHVYFAYPGMHLKNTAGVLGPGLDLRCCGGYVVTIGAVHSTGCVYTWKEGHTPNTAPIAQLPPWLLERLRSPRPASVGAEPTIHGKGYASAALASEEQQLLATPVGQRNQRLNLAAFRLARFVASGALAQADVESVLFAAALRLGLSEREARATIASGLRAGTSR
jgi:hypothetical protein